MCKTIKQKVSFKAPPKEIYDLLTESKKYEAVTGKKAQIGKSAGDKFSVYGGQATGIMVELVRNKRIVQAWRGHSFPEGIFSMATINLKPTPRGGTYFTVRLSKEPNGETSAMMDWTTALKYLRFYEPIQSETYGRL